MARISMGEITRALVVEGPDGSLDEALESAGLEVRRVPGAPSEAELISLLHETGAQVIFKRSRTLVTRQVIESCPALLAIQLCCIGDDSVDKQACADNGIMVFNDPVSNARSVVELVISHVIALARRLYETDVSCRAGVWEKSNEGRYEVKGKVLGVVGLGNIGRQVARAAESMGMRIRFFDSRYAAQEVGIEFGWEESSTLPDLFRKSDFVTAHLSARDASGKSNEGILSREILAQLGANRGPASPKIFLNL